jgi:hypothetical protein
MVPRLPKLFGLVSAELLKIIGDAGAIALELRSRHRI